MSNFFEEQVLSVHHWTDRLFSFTTTRDPGFRFRTGEFTMIGLKVDGRPLLRAYSVVSPAWAETLEFFSIKVPNGPLTSRLQHIQVGDAITVGRKATGTLVMDNLLPGKNLYLLGTGTGLAPFLSVIRDPETYERFEKVVLVHGCRHVADLAYEDLITKELPAHEFLGEEIAAKLLYYPTVTREPFRNTGRISTLLESGKLVAAGPFADDFGALIVYNADSPEAAEDLIRNDPFHAAGVFVRWTVRPWKQVFANTQLMPTNG